MTALPSASPGASEALARLEGVLAGSTGLLVAFSGGVDSAVLLAAAHRVLGSRAVGLIADSPSVPRAEIDAARSVAAEIGVELIVAPTGELERDDYRRNDTSRCYFCKQTLFATCERIAQKRGIPQIAYGYTVDDGSADRPGHRAATELSIRAPLLEAGLGKTEIRAIARELGLVVWDKPAAPCLASRIPHGSEVTSAKLAVIEAMEALLHELGFAVCRTRYDGALMRIEVESREIARVAAFPVIARLRERARSLGVERLMLDLDGFRSGKLTAEALH